MFRFFLELRYVIIQLVTYVVTSKRAEEFRSAT